MKALLMHRDRDFDPKQEPPWNSKDLTEDLELGTLLRAMAGGDPFLRDVAQTALFSGTQNEVETILYRQDVLKDCLKNPEAARKLYAHAVETIEGRKRSWLGILSHSATGILCDSVSLMQMLAGALKKLRKITDEHAGQFESEGLTTLCTLIRNELSDDYFAAIHDHLKRLRFNKGVLVSAELGQGNASRNYVLRRPPDTGPNWIDLILRRTPPAYSFKIHPRDEAGARILSEMRGRGVNLVANALAQSTDHVLSFFHVLRAEMGFYCGCLNLHDRMNEIAAPVCFPTPSPADRRGHRFRGLYDVCLALTMGRTVVGNDADAGGRNLVIITGANQGGKSTFLRGIGLAQMMMQCGMFVAAGSFEANLCTSVITHYKREEDATMKHGKLDEELVRMSDIADRIAPHSLLLFNESFASTNEREGSEIARQIVRALLEKRMKVFFVTHQHEFARGMFDRKMDDAFFLRAERLPDGTRTFRLLEGEPMQTSYGADLYREVFANDTERLMIGC